jgi:zinc protease
MKDDLDKLLPVIKDVITNPTFPEEEITKRKQRWIAELDQAKESPRQVIGAYYNKFLFTDSPYGNPVDGIKKTIEQIDQKCNFSDFYLKKYSIRKLCYSCCW